MHSQLAVHHGPLLGVAPHRTGAHHCIARMQEAADVVLLLLVTLHSRTLCEKAVTP